MSADNFEANTNLVRRTPNGQRRTQNNMQPSDDTGPETIVTADDINLVPIYEVKTKPRLLNYEDLPSWYQDNEFIQKFYRPVSGSFRASIKSIFWLHNESFNIWSHLLPFFPTLGFALYLIYSAVAYALSASETADWVVFRRQLLMIFFYLSPCSMFIGSASLHTCMNHSQKIAARFSCFDYGGIIIMINGGIVTYCYYAFYGALTPQIIYMAGNMVISVISCFFVSRPFFYTSEYRHVRGILFVGLGLAAVIPFVHLLITQGLAHCYQELYMVHILVMAVLYILGAWLFVVRIPEKYYPGVFDLIGNSHNLLHFMVVLATGILIYGVEGLKRRQELIEGR